MERVGDKLQKMEEGKGTMEMKRHVKEAVLVEANLTENHLKETLRNMNPISHRLM